MDGFEKHTIPLKMEFVLKRSAEDILKHRLSEIKLQNVAKTVIYGIRGTANSLEKGKEGKKL